MTFDPDRFGKALLAETYRGAVYAPTWEETDEAIQQLYCERAAAVLELSRAEAGDALLVAAQLRQEMGYQPGLRTLLARLHKAAKAAVEGATVHSELSDYCVECDVFNELDQAVVAVDAAMAAALKGEKLPP